uniref:Uncharacterized protein n=1 Tax=uncultured Campylobacterota bacterium TaxID=120858 RepID=Q2YZL6_9BACT|nr:hypothetical protein [uncultured Campylobacterota bacterium]
MELFFLYLITGSILFLYSFYDSFYHAEVYLFSYVLTPLELTISFYLFLLSVVFLLYKKSILSLRSKKQIYELSIFHFLITFSLLFIAQYTYCMFFQFIYLLLLLDFNKKNINNSIFLFYLLLAHYALVLEFTSDRMILYFLNLFAATLLIYRQKRFFSKLEYLACGICVVILLLIFNIFDTFIYDIYIWLDIVDAPKFINSEVLYLLSLLHIFLFFFVEFKKK